MQWKWAKLKAQAVLFLHWPSAFFVSIFSLFCKTFFFLSFLFCAFLALGYSFIFPDYFSAHMKIALLFLFSFGSLSALFLYSLFPFLKTRWFLNCQKSGASLKKFFKPLGFSVFIKASLLYFYQAISSFFLILFYFLPFFAFSAWFFYHLKTSGFVPLLFYIALSFFVLLFSLCLYFFLWHIQKNQLLFFLLILKPQESCKALIRLSATLMAPYQQKILWKKLQFSFWFLLCLFPFAFPYVSSYYALSLCFFDEIILKEAKLPMRHDLQSTKSFEKAKAESLAKVPLLQYTN